MIVVFEPRDPHALGVPVCRDPVTWLLGPPSSSLQSGPGLSTRAGA